MNPTPDAHPSPDPSPGPARAGSPRADASAVVAFVCSYAWAWDHVLPRLGWWESHAGGAAVIALICGVVVRTRRASARAIAAARDAHRQLAAIVDAAPIGIYTADADGLVRTWNAAAERTYGWTAAEAIGHPLRVVPPGREAAHAALRQVVLAGRSIPEVESIGCRRDGSLVEVTVAAAPLRDGRGRVAGAVVLAADVTAKRAAERAVAEGQARFARMTANLPGTVFEYVVRPDGSTAYTYVSDGSREMFGLPPDAVRADAGSIVRQVLPEDAASFRAGVAESRASLRRWGWEGRFRHAGTGQVRWLAAAARPARLPDGTTVWDGVMSDVTELKDVQAAAVAASRAKSEFLANMSHEIRTPLNGIVGMLALLGGTPLDVQQRRYAAVADASAASLLTLINDILDFSKIEAGKLELDAVPFDLADVAEQAVAVLWARAGGKGLAVACEVDPALARRRVGPADRVRQVLVNLLGNAVKFTDVGSVTLAVTADADDAIRFAVTDTGIGIPADRLDRLFQSFSQVDASTTRKYGGTGLGLAISRQLAGLMGGTVGVRSEVGRGSTFWFTARLPTTDAAAAPVPVASVTPAPTAGRRVLVAEDNEVNQMVVGEMLRRLGYAHDLVADGRAAADAAAGGGYDLVLMDCQMPELDGFEAAAAIRAAEAAAGRPRLPVIALTANAIKGDRERCLAAGMDDYLSKPIDTAALAAKLAAWLSPARRAA